MDLPDTPLATFEPSDQYIDLGEEAQFYCEAFVGAIPLPDSKSTITWFRTTENGLEEMLEQRKLDRYVAKLQLAWMIFKVELFTEN